jgi:hypothetical protein
MPTIFEFEVFQNPMCSKINLFAAACVNSEEGPFSKLPTVVKIDPRPKFAAARAGGSRP